MTLDPFVTSNSSPSPPKHKLIKEQRNLAKKHDIDPAGQIDKHTERTNERWTEKQMERQTEEEAGDEDEETSRPIVVQHTVEVDVEINIIQIENVSESEKTPTPPLIKPSSKRKPTTPQRRRGKPCGNGAPADSAVTSSVHQRPSLISSPSQVSIMSETAAEELCDLRNYYSKQLRRINYISHEYLGQQHSEPGVLGCIREPLRSLRLPRGVTIARTARSLWTRVSGRRKLVHR